ncbi:MAG TPA: hypothetical protein VJ571_06735 [Candidatus Nitrosotalea sp.]|nr:hypothetical protein [Candidatus Nitrosotalea sp.]
MEKYHVNYEDVMKTNMFFLTTIMSIVVILATNAVTPALALNNTAQKIHADLTGFTVMSECCPIPKVHVEGNLITQSNGTMNLSTQSGVVMIGTTSYDMKFEPLNKTSITHENTACKSGTNYEQSGVVELTGKDGDTFKGSGVYSWGSTSGCPDGDSSFTYFSGNIQDAQGQIIEFFTGTDSLPVIQ